jgi:hypothetical protein
MDAERNNALDSELARLSTYWSARRATEKDASVTEPNILAHNIPRKVH